MHGGLRYANPPYVSPRGLFATGPKLLVFVRIGRGDHRIGRVALVLVMQAAQGAVERAFELVGGAADRLVLGGCVIADGDRLVSGNPCFHQDAVVAIH